MPSFAEQIRADLADYNAQYVPTHPGGRINLYVLVDCAQEDTLGAELDGRSRQVRFLARSGRNGPALVSIGQGEGTLDWLFAHGGGKRWFITILSQFDFDEVWGHARKFTRVRLHDGRQVSYRYYDPQILMDQTRALTIGQRQAFFARYRVLYAEIAAHVFRLYLRPDGNIVWKVLSDAVPDGEGPSEGMWTIPPIDFSGSATHPLLTLSKQQYEMPVLMNTPRLMQDLYLYLLPDHEWHMKLHIPGVVRAMIEVGAMLALRDYRIDDLECVRTFVDLQWRVAPGFDLEPRINKLLKTFDLSPAERFDRLASPAYTDAIADAFGYDDVKHWRLPFDFPDDV